MRNWQPSRLVKVLEDAPAVVSPKSVPPLCRGIFSILASCQVLSVLYEYLTIVGVALSARHNFYLTSRQIDGIFLPKLLLHTRKGSENEKHGINNDARRDRE